MSPNLRALKSFQSLTTFTQSYHRPEGYFCDQRAIVAHHLKLSAIQHLIPNDFLGKHLSCRFQSFKACLFVAWKYRAFIVL